MQALPHRALLAPLFAAQEPRSRLVAAMAEALQEKSFGSTSVADVVRLARVSKRTFYEHFASREACYLAAYDVMSTAMLGAIAEAAASTHTLEERLTAAVHSYLSTLEELPALTRTFYTEIQLAGGEALLARRRVHQRFADLLQALVEEGSREWPVVRPLTPDLAIALVGAINELLLVRIEEGRLGELRALTGTIVQVIRAFVLEPGGAAP